MHGTRHRVGPDREGPLYGLHSPIEERGREPEEDDHPDQRDERGADPPWGDQRAASARVSASSKLGSSIGSGMALPTWGHATAAEKSRRESDRSRGRVAPLAGKADSPWVYTRVWGLSPSSMPAVQ